MSFAETPAVTDIEYVKQQLEKLTDIIEAQNDRQDAFVLAINSMGQNLQWIVDNVQGIFKMFSDPGVINQMMTGMMGNMGMMGGIPDGGPGSGPEAGPQD